MRRVHSCVVFVLLLVCGVSFAVPAEDLAETRYDESESQPCESRSPISSLMEQTAIATRTSLPETAAAQNVTLLQTSSSFPVGAKPIARPVNHRFTEPRSLLSQVCTLLF
jgi:hypothetical protein